MDIAALKSRLGILEVAERLGITVDPKTGRALCPFHGDKKPSLQFSKEKGICTCFSSNCSAGTMDIVSLTEKYKKCSTKEAVKWLRSLLGETPRNPLLPKPQTEKPNYGEAFEEMRGILALSSTARNYAEGRCLDRQLLEVGHNPLKNPRAPYLKGCITFPLKNTAGEITALYGRSVHSDGDNAHYYTKDRKGLYPQHPVHGTETLILTESVIDAATLLSIPKIRGKHGVLALYGTNGLTTEHVDAIQRTENLQELILFFDGDPAGKAAGQKHGAYLQKMLPKLKISVVETPEDEDVNSIAQGHEAGIFAELLKNRKAFSFSAAEEKSGTEKTVEIPKPKFDTSDAEHLVYLYGPLRFTLLGGIAHRQADRMRATLKLAPVPQLSPLHSLRMNVDLYQDEQCEKFCRRAAEKLEVGTVAVRGALGALIEELEKYRQSQRRLEKAHRPKPRSVGGDRKAAALSYLKSPKLMERTGECIGKTGVVGEENNRLLMYLVFTSRLREQPLHIVTLGQSGSGKTYLQERIAALIPESEKVELTALSDNALYYFGRGELKHKLLLVEDLDGAEGSLYPLRELMSKKRISRTVPVKDANGNMQSLSLQVEGPVCAAGTTTREQLYADNADRSLLIWPDNSRRQQQAIMAYQSQLSAGTVNNVEENRTKELFRDIQALLRPIAVRNPYAEQLRVPPEVFKPLRTNAHYLAFIETVTFYHQYQREVKQDKTTGEKFIESTLEDIQWANRLLSQVILAKSDELSGGCRRFHERLRAHLQKEKMESFYARDVRTALKVSPTTLKRHLNQLVQYGQLETVGGNRYRGLEYKMANGEGYGNLEGKVKNALDNALERIRKNGSGPVAQ
jgi:DNA primase